MDGPLDGINFNQVCNNEIKVLLCSLRGRRLSFSCASFFTRSLRVHWKCQVILVHFAASTVEVQYYGKQQQQQRQPSPPTRLRPRHTWPSHSRAARAIKWSEASQKALKMKPGSSGRVEMWRGRDICKRGDKRKGRFAFWGFKWIAVMQRGLWATLQTTTLPRLRKKQNKSKDTNLYSQMCRQWKSRQNAAVADEPNAEGQALGLTCWSGGADKHNFPSPSGTRGQIKHGTKTRSGIKQISLPDCVGLLTKWLFCSRCGGGPRKYWRGKTERV